jgi:aspartyl/glutamyl-tRNA(Asn/Gln) amidotransferase C subunit
VNHASPQQSAPLRPDDVHQLASLAHLRVSDERAAQLCAELSSVLASMEVLRTLPLQGLSPLTHVHESTNVLRSDTPGDTLPPGLAASLPEGRLSESELLAGYVQVPKVLRQPSQPPHAEGA